MRVYSRERKRGLAGRLARSGLLVAASIWSGPIAFAQSSLYEAEPNDTPAQANEFSGAVVLVGSMRGQDQDGYRWVVSDVDARKRWNLELQGIPGKLTIVEVLQVEYADNGVDVAATNRLFTIGTRDGSRSSIHENLLFEPGEYILGVAHGGGSASYRPPADSIGFGVSGEEQPGAETAAGGYRLTISEGNWAPLQQQVDPRATRETAYGIRLETENAAYIDTPAAWYKLDISDSQADKRRDVTGQIPVGRKLTAVLRAGDGSGLAETATDDKGRFAFRDLGLDVGTYFIELKSETGGYIRTLRTTTVGQRIEGAEAEPNDTWPLANRTDPRQTVTGWMRAGNETDYFAFSLDELAADQVLTLVLETAAGTKLQLCLTDHQGARVQCKSAEGGVALADLVLQPGEWGFVVERGPEAADYSVTLREQGPVTRDIETEPNDKIGNAVAVPAGNRIKGRFVGDESDFFKFVVADEPQLWRFQVMGDELFELAYIDGAGIQNQVYRAAAGQRRLRLDNVFLMPGVHHIRVSGRDGGSYTLLARALGPPDPDGEFEPNDDTSRMQPLRFGQTRKGLLADVADNDYYRFHLAAWDRIRLTLEPPPDGEILATLYWDGSSFKQFNRPVAGQQVVLEGVFPPGDYQLALKAKTISEAEYRLGLERLARFGCPTDCEPNDNADFANPLPADHVLEGISNEWRDSDWYQMPVFDAPSPVTLTSESKQTVRIVTAEYAAKNLVVWDAEAGLWRGTIPAGTQTYAEIRTSGPYRFEVDFPGGPQAIEPSGVAPLVAELTLDTDEVAAYRQYAQQVAGELHLHNSGTSPLSVALETATSDHRWRIELDQTSMELMAGGSSTVSLLVRVPPDAWADWPVRVSVRASTGQGDKKEVFTEIRSGRETLPVNVSHGWALPEALLGGFNVAWQALGSRWTGEYDSAIGTGISNLFDGMAVENQGMQLRGGTAAHSVDIVVELAGGEPVEVVGLTTNALAGGNALRFLRNLDFSLSLDGLTFTPALLGELSPVKTEQAFVLDQPTLARYARLRPRHAFDGAAGPAIVLGELKVITRPGVDISGGKGFNLAEPALGGHVVWSQPGITPSYWDGDMLLADGKYNHKRVKAGQTLTWAIGFHHDRAAQISRLEWVNAEDAPVDGRISEVLVSVSTDSPVGPWRSVGKWALSQDDAESVLNLPEPIWARFVRFSVAAPDQQKTHVLPDVVKIWERPTQADYRSVLTEWGFASQAAFYEQQRPVGLERRFVAADHFSKATAASLEYRQLAAGQVVLGEHTHWYRIDVPAHENTLTIAIGGDPTVRTAANLEDSDGTRFPMRAISHSSTPSLQVFEAVVDPGARYFLNVFEPPRNVVFLWDTSASVGAYLPVIYNAMMAYAADVEPGRDAANFMPFGSDLLLKNWYGEPYILQTILNDYPRKESSSEAEATLAQATRNLAPRAGTKAVVMVTDAATNRYAPVWNELDRVKPRIFGLGVGSQGAFGRSPVREQDLMQDWSRVNGGHYTYLLSEGAMEVAFDRAATMLRRPADYTLEVTGSFKEAAGPGSLTVVSGNRDGSEGSIADGAIALILDASGSMLKKLEGKRRIDIAKEVLSEAVTEHIPAGTPVALRVFGHKEPNACRTDLEIPLSPLDASAASSVIDSVQARNLAKTPIADSLAAVATDLSGVSGQIVVVLVTDGEETCEGDPAKAIQALQDKGIAVALNIVGFAIDDSDLAAQFRDWATLGGGRYFTANNQERLSTAMVEALKVPFAVYDQGGALVGEGVLDGEPLALEAGYYRVVLRSAPVQTYSEVEVLGQHEVVLVAGEASN